MALDAGTLETFILFESFLVPILVAAGGIAVLKKTVSDNEKKLQSHINSIESVQERVTRLEERQDTVREDITEIRDTVRDVSKLIQEIKEELVFIKARTSKGGYDG